MTSGHLLRICVAAACLVAIAVCVWRLEAARAGLVIEHVSAGTVPVTIHRRPDAEGPAVVIAHGFAGSRQWMQALAIGLARAGYVAVSFDFAGHGRNRTPMTGDITRIEGTTQQLMTETARVIDTALMVTPGHDRVALLGHSMAADIIVRQAIADNRVAAVVGISMHSEAITAREPANLLAVSGQWERGLRASALAALRLVSPDANEGDTVEDAASGTMRRAAVAPNVEHVGVLYSSTTLAEALAWLDETFERDGGAPVALNGGWLALLLAAIIALGWPLAACLPRGPAPQPIPARRFALAVGIAALATPLLLTWFELRFLPVMVADYLAVHLAVYGILALAILWRGGIRFGKAMPLATALVALYGIAVFGFALDRYAASFLPHAGRWPVILAVALGAVPVMLADAVLCEAGHARLWRVIAARGGFLASLALAIALDFERLFFLIIALPVIIVFFIAFGLLGGWAGRRTGSPAVSGIALGVILAWSIGVSFPLYAP